MEILKLKKFQLLRRQSEPTRTPEDLGMLRSIMEDTILIDCCVAFTQENGEFLGSGTLVSIDNIRADTDRRSRPGGSSARRGRALDLSYAF